jgi:hypothetical protein
MVIPTLVRNSVNGAQGDASGLEPGMTVWIAR